MARRTNREWATRLIPNGLDHALQLWDPECGPVNSVPRSTPLQRRDSVPPDSEAAPPLSAPALEPCSNPFPVFALLDAALLTGNGRSAAQTAELDDASASTAESGLSADGLMECGLMNSGPRSTRQNSGDCDASRASLCSKASKAGTCGSDGASVGPGRAHETDAFYTIAKVVRRTSALVDPRFLGPAAHTPRSDYLRQLLPLRDSDGVLPVPSLLRVKKRSLDLTGLGLGDAVVAALAKVLPRLEPIEALLLQDNRLTDASLTAVCVAACRDMPGLTALNLSGNEMDASAAELRHSLATEGCTLQRLWLDRADVDDAECGELCAALCHNDSLVELSLADNMIGESELLNAVMPDVVTGGEAIAAMLCRNGRLTKLDLSWNKIRRASATALARALAHNAAVAWLSLAHNGFGDEASQEFGAALVHNAALTFVDLSYNGVSPKAAMVMGNALQSNATLHTLCLAGNAVGKRGGEALVTAMRRCQRPSRFLRIDLGNADLDSDAFDVAL